MSKAGSPLQGHGVQATPFPPTFFCHLLLAFGLLLFEPQTHRAGYFALDWATRITPSLTPTYCWKERDRMIARQDTRSGTHSMEDLSTRLCFVPR